MANSTGPHAQELVDAERIGDVRTLLTERFSSRRVKKVDAALEAFQIELEELTCVATPPTPVAK